MELPETGIQKLLSDSIQKRIDEEKKRDYLGTSILGIECERQLWYTWHEPKREHSPRIQMIFDMGHIIEDYLIGLLRAAGLKVWTQTEDGKQFGFVDGYVAGHWDGVIQGIPESTKPHLLEIKSINDKGFQQYVKKGVKVNNKVYWIQMQVYMLKSGLENAQFMMMNKNTCELYFERIKLDAAAADGAILRGEEMIASKERPRRQYKKSTFFKCRFCNWNETCWEGDE